MEPAHEEQWLQVLVVQLHAHLRLGNGDELVPDAQLFKKRANAYSEKDRGSYGTEVQGIGLSDWEGKDTSNLHFFLASGKPGITEGLDLFGSFEDGEWNFGLVEEEGEGEAAKTTACNEHLSLAEFFVLFSGKGEGWCGFGLAHHGWGRPISRMGHGALGGSRRRHTLHKVACGWPEGGEECQ